MNITSRSEAFSLQEVHYLLQSHEISLEQLSVASVIDVPLVAHIIVGGVQNSNTNDGRFKGSSNINFRPINVRNPQTSRIVCQLCGKMGHTAMKCFHRFDVYFQSPPRAQNQQFSSLHQPQQPQLQPLPLQPQMQPQSQPHIPQGHWYHHVQFKIHTNNVIQQTLLLMPILLLRILIQTLHGLLTVVLLTT